MLRVSGGKDEIKEVLNSIDDVVSVKFLKQFDDTSYDFEIEASVEIDSEFNKKLFFAFAEKTMPIVMQKKVEDSLEDVFLQITSDDAAAQENGRDDGVYVTEENNDAETEEGGEKDNESDI